MTNFERKICANWKNKEMYPIPKKEDEENHWAWEFARRNREFQSDWQRAKKLDEENHWAWEFARRNREFQSDWQRAKKLDDGKYLISETDRKSDKKIFTPFLELKLKWRIETPNDVDIDLLDPRKSWSPEIRFLNYKGVFRRQKDEIGESLFLLNESHWSIYAESENYLSLVFDLRLCGDKTSIQKMLKTASQHLVAANLKYLKNHPEERFKHKINKTRYNELQKYLRIYDAHRLKVSEKEISNVIIGDYGGLIHSSSNDIVKNAVTATEKRIQTPWLALGTTEKISAPNSQ